MLVAALAALATLAAADTTTYVVLNHGRPAGDMRVVRAGDSVTVRYLFVDRNRGTRLEQRYRLRADGSVVAAESRPVGAAGTAGEPTDRFEVVADSVRRSGRGPVTVSRAEAGTYYGINGTPYDLALLARHLLRQPGRQTTLPGGATVRLEIARDTLVRTGAGRERVRLALLHPSTGGTATALWLDARDALFASAVGWFITVRPGAEGALPTLRAIETAYRDARADSIARALVRPAPSTLAIRNGDLFDSETGTVRPRETVLVRGDRIVAVGPADSIAIPDGSTVIDATGRTVMPGMWEMHGHLQLTSETGSALLQLALGITTVRDLASDIDVATSQRDRTDAGRLVGPRYLLAGFIEGPGRWAGPTDVLVRTEDEARAWVAKYAALGYRQIKVYNLVHPDLIPTIAEEAHRRGMRLSGHVPRGLTVPAAVALGFDEINHAAFLFSTFYQDSLYVPTMRAYSAVAAAVAPNVDVDGPGMTALIDVLRAHGTVVDGTFAIWMTSSGADVHYVRLIKRLYDAGVPLVAGTDQSGSGTYPTELELYERAGIPAPEVLRIATLGAARVMKEDRDYGSIVGGKVADLVIVDGRPAERVADVRNVVLVVRAGRVFDPQALRAAAGVRPR